jgi:hypothetical protein
VELGDDATYPMRGFGSIFFHIPSSDVIELSNSFFVFGLKKNNHVLTHKSTKRIMFAKNCNTLYL